MLRADAFWLRSDGGFGDSRLYGFNVENVATESGRFGAMYIDVYDGNVLQYDGVKAWNLRALGVPVPGVPQLKLYAEVVWQLGEDDDGGGFDNNGLGWYLESAYTLPRVPWTTILTYRYAFFPAPISTPVTMRPIARCFTGSTRVNGTRFTWVKSPVNTTCSTATR